MELRVKKDEFVGNFYGAIEKFGSIVGEVREKGAEKWECTRKETVDMYEAVMRRIKEKEIQIRTEYGITCCNEKEEAPSTKILPALLTST